MYPIDPDGENGLDLLVFGSPQLKVDVALPYPFCDYGCWKSLFNSVIRHTTSRCRENHSSHHSDECVLNVITQMRESLFLNASTEQIGGCALQTVSKDHLVDGVDEIKTLVGCSRIQHLVSLERDDRHTPIAFRHVLSELKDEPTSEGVDPQHVLCS